jgi:hypothetical protein
MKKKVLELSFLIRNITNFILNNMFQVLVHGTFSEFMITNHKRYGMIYSRVKIVLTRVHFEDQ